MGADLYIEKINKPIQEKYEPLFEAAVRRRDSLPRGSKEAEPLKPKSPSITT